MHNIELTGGSSFVESGINKLDTGTKLNIIIEFREVVPNQIILEADAPYGTYDLRITENGKLGFTAENLAYEFDYTPVANKKLNLTIETKPMRTVLKTGMFTRKRAIGSFSFNGTVRKSGIKNASFSIPVQRIGSKTNSVHARIHSITVK